MEKTIKIGEKEVKISNNIGWMLEYRSQFGVDIVPALMPALASVVDIVGGIVDGKGSAKDITAKDIITVLRSDAGIDALAHLSGLEFVDFVNIFWAMAKTADDSIPEPRTWVKQFDEFPVDVIAPAVFELAFKGCISSKNWERLKNVKAILQPETKNQV